MCERLKVGETDDITVRFQVLVALTMESASTSETYVNSYQTTRRNNPEDSQPSSVAVRPIHEKTM
jgi:hypothetical protein